VEKCLLFEDASAIIGTNSIFFWSMLAGERVMLPKEQHSQASERIKTVSGQSFGETH
jgi:hypothetical protein